MFFLFKYTRHWRERYSVFETYRFCHGIRAPTDLWIIVKYNRIFFLFFLDLYQAFCVISLVVAKSVLLCACGGVRWPFWRFPLWWSCGGGVGSLLIWCDSLLWLGCCEYISDFCGGRRSYRGWKGDRRSEHPHQRLLCSEWFVEDEVFKRYCFFLFPVTLLKLCLGRDGSVELRFRAGLWLDLGCDWTVVGLIGRLCLGCVGGCLWAAFGRCL